MTSKIGWNLTDWNHYAPRIAGWFIAIHCLVWTLLPTFFFPVAQLDTTEGLMWGWQWQWGYYKHPFLAPLATVLGNYIGTGTPGFGVYLASQLFYVFCFWGVYRFARLFLQPAAALIALLVLESIHFYSFESTQLDPNVAMLPFWVWATYFFYRAIQTQRIRPWLFCGILLGLGSMAKYETAVLIIVMLLFLLWNPVARQSFKKAGVYIAILMCVLVVTPNSLWVMHHQYMPITYTFSETDQGMHHLGFFASRALHTVLYLAVNIGNLLPLLLILIPFYRGGRDRVAKATFDREFLWMVALGAPLFTLLLTVIFGIDVRGQWSLPFFTLLGVLVMYEWQPVLSAIALKRFLCWVAGFLVLFAVGTAVGVHAFPYIEGRPTQKQFPAPAVTQYALTQWQALYGTPKPYLMGDRGMVSNTVAYSKDQLKPIVDFSLEDSTWLTRADVCRSGAIWVWRQGDTVSWQAATQLFPLKDWKNRENKTFLYSTKAPISPINLVFFFLPPGEC